MALSQAQLAKKRYARAQKRKGKQPRGKHQYGAPGDIQPPKDSDMLVL